MKYSLLVLGSPQSSLAPFSALKFAKAAITKGHKVSRVFFYEDGVHIANRFSTPPRDEINIRSEWEAFRKAHDTDLVVCIAAAVKRGVLDDREAKRYEIAEQGNISESFELSGLGQLVEATETSDRLITFS